MNIIACCKVVPEEQDISINSDRSLSLDKAAPKISQYDLNALEAAVQIAEANGGEVTALSIGSKRFLENSKVRKDLLSRGPSSLSLVIDDSLDSILPNQTASIIANAVSQTTYDLIICGEGSGDLYAQQVGILLGETLNVPCINAVSKITVDGSNVIVERSLEDEIEVLRLPLPAVLSVTTDINTPKIPNMKAILAAGKKPVNLINVDNASQNNAPLSTVKSTLAPEQVERLNKIIEGDSDDEIASFVENLRQILN